MTAEEIDKRLFEHPAFNSTPLAPIRSKEAPRGTTGSLPPGMGWKQSP